MPRNPPPKYPRPLVFPNGRKPTKKEKQEHIVYSISFYSQRLNELKHGQPLIIKKKWKEEVLEVEGKLSDLEYKLLEYTQPDIYNEVEHIGKNNV